MSPTIHRCRLCVIISLVLLDGSHGLSQFLTQQSIDESKKGARKLMRSVPEEKHTESLLESLCKEDAIPLQNGGAGVPKHAVMTCNDFVVAAHHYLHHSDAVDTFVTERLRPQLESKFNFDGLDKGSPLAARFILEQHMYALRHAWVALNGLNGQEAKQQQDRLQDLHSKTKGFRSSDTSELGDEDAEEMVNMRWHLAKEIHKALTSHTMQSMLEASRMCIAPHKKLNNTHSLRQRSRIRPAGRLTRNSSILLSSPDGKASEESKLKMPLLILGTGYTECYKDRAIIHNRSGGLERARMGDPGSCSLGGDLPEPGFYKNAVQMGYKAVDTAYSYGTEKQIGAELSGRNDLFLATKTMSPAFRDMLGVKHGTDTIKDQLQALDRNSVNVLYNHRDPADASEWKLLEEVVDKGHAQALGTSGIRDALDHEKCVRSGRCKHHVALIQESFSPCSGSNYPLSDEDVALLENTTLVAHSTIWPCEGEPVFEKVAKRLGKTVPQLAIRLVLEQGIPVIAQTKNPQHLQDNLDVFDFEMSSADLGQLALIPDIYSLSEDLFKL